jgi:hypothetical protein
MGQQHTLKIKLKLQVRKFILDCVIQYNTHVILTNREKSIVLFTVGAIPTIAISIWNVGVIVAEPAVNTNWKSAPKEKINKMLEP